MNLENYTDGFFEVNHINGFLPLKSPLAKLPSRYIEIQALIDEMPIKKADETDGLLSKRVAREKRVKELTKWKDKVEQEEDEFIVQALVRDWRF